MIARYVHKLIQPLAAAKRLYDFGVQTLARGVDNGDDALALLRVLRDGGGEDVFGATGDEGGVADAWGGVRRRRRRRRRR